MLRQLAEVSAGNIVMATLGMPEESIKDRDIAVRDKFVWTLRLLRATLIYYGVRKPGKLNACIHYVRVVAAYLFALKAIYDGGFYLLLLMNHWGTERNIADIVILSWNAQCGMSMMFLLYWQYCGYIREIFFYIHVPRDCKEYTDIIGSIRRSIGVSIVVFLLCSFFFLAILAVHYFRWGDDSLFNIQDFNVLIRHEYLPLHFVLMLHGFFVWNVVITFYVTVSRVVLYEMQTFNTELASIGEADASPDGIADQLLSHFIRHIELAKTVRAVDNTFEVYVFVMIGTNIPTTIFSLLTLIRGLSQSWIIVSMAVPGVFFSVIELIGLTAVPAKLHDTIKRVESIIYTRPAIWYPFNDKVYNIAAAFVAHVRQTNLGVTLWGFAVVSKPLILTTVSLTVTYLSLLLQMNAESVSSLSANETASWF